jgi:hypothetical protein
VEYHAQVPAALARGEQPFMQIEGSPVMGIGRMRNSPGWQPKHMLVVWQGQPVMIRYAARTQIVERGPKGRRLVAAPARFQRDIIIPKIVKVESEAHELELSGEAARRQGKGSPYSSIPAERMPAELKDMLIDVYAGDMSQDLLAIVGDRMREREAEKRARSREEKALPVRTPAATPSGAASRGPAGCARKPKAKPRRANR